MDATLSHVEDLEPINNQVNDDGDNRNLNNGGNGNNGSEVPAKGVVVTDGNSEQRGGESSAIAKFRTTMLTLQKELDNQKEANAKFTEIYEKQIESLTNECNLLRSQVQSAPAYHRRNDVLNDVARSLDMDDPSFVTPNDAGSSTVNQVYGKSAND